MEKQSTTKGFAILTVATMLGKIFSLLYLPFLIRVLADEGYGIYQATYTVFLFIYGLTSTGISTAVSKYISELTALENYKAVKRAFKLTMLLMFLLGLFMTLVLAFGAKFFANFTEFDEAKISLITLSPTIFLTAVVSVYRGYFQGSHYMTPTAISQVIEQIANVFFSILFAYLWMPKGVEWGVAGATIGTPLGALAALMYLHVVYIKRAKIKMPQSSKIVKAIRNKTIVKNIVNIALPIAISQGVINAAFIVDTKIVMSRLMVAGFSKNEATILFGILAKYNTLSNVPIAIIIALSTSVLPSIAAVIATNNTKAAVAKINYSIKLCLLVAVPCTVGLSALSEPIYRLLLGQGHELMMYGSFIIIIWSLVQIHITILQSINKMYVATILMVIGLIPKILLDYILVVNIHLHIYGVLIANLVYYALPLFLMRNYMRNKLKLRVKILSQFIKPCIASLWMGIAGILSYNGFFKALHIVLPYKLSILIAVSIAIIIAAYLYVTILIFSGVITERDINSISPKIKKLLPKILRRKLIKQTA
ncbi:putative polysaccharide biosynthesis protein [Clostridium cellulovorans]|uniref:Polysaccharide biosynthesis protein n=1 Tax=Clostridium cellulovorans (strain ATCC 35296 / DSM 3052 / OCM 3 / 743B) TaxID=573061 RepID=D9SMT1_CLOC7|nr:polysaccharide biosynthesis protein [Clostridium cellulovorans]ADL49866.1 polysaccharide biosynthesis protein [Clostridium cellulovorans 743B]